jgi:hypothetical protein
MSLESLLCFIGGPDKLIELLLSDEKYSALIASALTTEYFKDITGGFLVHVLSYTCLSDTLNVMLTCKAWYQATRVRAFWTQRVLSAKVKYLQKLINPNPMITKIIMEFDTWISVTPESITEILRDHLEWLFQSSYLIDVQTPEKNMICVQRRSHRGYSTLYIFAASTTKLFACQWLENIDKSGKFRFIAYNTKMSLRVLEQNEYNGHIGNGEWVNKKGDAFIGQLISVNDKWLPHGSGEWTLSDGTIIEGENVADHGTISVIKSHHCSKEEEK